MGWKRMDFCQSAGDAKRFLKRKKYIYRNQSSKCVSNFLLVFQWDGAKGHKAEERSTSEKAVVFTGTGRKDGLQEAGNGGMEKGWGAVSVRSVRATDWHQSMQVRLAGWGGAKTSKVYSSSLYKGASVSRYLSIPEPTPPVRASNG